MVLFVIFCMNNLMSTIDSYDYRITLSFKFVRLNQIIELPTNGFDMINRNIYQIHICTTITIEYFI